MLVIPITMQTTFFVDPEPLLGTLARIFASEGAAREVAVLTYSTPKLVMIDSYGNTASYTLYLHVKLSLYTQLLEGMGLIEQSICDNAQVFLSQFPSDDLTQVKIVPAIVEDSQWREKAAAWITGDKLSNQGRVRSNNVAPLAADGLLFRSNAEIHLYRSLKALGVSFAPLPVFVRGGDGYRRIESDFFLIHGGIAMVVEVDGDTVHQETPAEAHDRTSMLQREGVYIERIKSSECDSAEKAKIAAQKIMSVIEKVRTTR